MRPDRFLRMLGFFKIKIGFIMTYVEKWLRCLVEVGVIFPLT